MRNSQQQQKILSSKLHRPRIPSNTVLRLRLLEQLEKDSERPFTLVSAPTGFGKSILVSQWLERVKHPTTWVSLDEKENELPQFLNYFNAAIELIFPGDCQNIHLLLQQSPLPKVDEICTILINDISQIKSRFILVLDDYQLISNSIIHDLIKELMRHPSRKMHLVLITRTDPPLPIIHYLSKSLMTLVSKEALRFTNEETGDLLERCIPGRFKETDTEQLVKKMEGWITGISLTILSLFEDQHLNVETISKRTVAYLQKYLTAEFTKNIQPELAQYSLECSVLDAYSAPLARHDYSTITHNEGEMKPDTAGFMLDLDKSHLLTNCADCNKHWCSLQPLFKDFLQNKMADEWSDEDLGNLQQSARNWYRENGHINEASNQAQLAGDKKNAAHISLENKHRGLNGGKWSDVEKWVTEIPEGIKKKHPITLPSAKLSYKTASGALTQLSRRESEVLNLVAQGLSNKEIASALYLSAETIKKHIYRIFQKLDTHSRTETIRKATEIGILL